MELHTKLMGPWFGPHKRLLHGFFRPKGPGGQQGLRSVCPHPHSFWELTGGHQVFFHVCERHGEMGLRRSWREVLTSQEATARDLPSCLSPTPYSLFCYLCDSPRGLASAVTNQTSLGCCSGDRKETNFVLSTLRHCVQVTPASMHEETRARM